MKKLSFIIFISVLLFGCSTTKPREDNIISSNTTNNTTTELPTNTTPPATSTIDWDEINNIPTSPQIDIDNAIKLNQIIYDGKNDYVKQQEYGSIKLDDDCEIQVRYSNGYLELKLIQKGVSIIEKNYNLNDLNIYVPNFRMNVSDEYFELKSIYNFVSFDYKLNLISDIPQIKKYDLNELKQLLPNEVFARINQIRYKDDKIIVFTIGASATESLEGWGYYNYDNKEYKTFSAIITDVDIYKDTITFSKITRNETNRNDSDVYILDINTQEVQHYEFESKQYFNSYSCFSSDFTKVAWVLLESQDIMNIQIYDLLKQEVIDNIKIYVDNRGREDWYQQSYQQINVTQFDSEKRVIDISLLDGLNYPTIVMSYRINY